MDLKTHLLETPNTSDAIFTALSNPTTALRSLARALAEAVYIVPPATISSLTVFLTSRGSTPYLDATSSAFLITSSAASLLLPSILSISATLLLIFFLAFCPLPSAAL
jgi:hypothetical protein